MTAYSESVDDTSKIDRKTSTTVAMDFGRITIDREDQGRALVLHNIEKDSNGHVRFAFNTSALGPGNYDLTIQGLTWRGEPVAQAWATIGIQR